MTNPYQSPEPLNDPVSPPNNAGKRMRRMGRLFIALGIVGLLLGPLCTAWGMMRAFGALAQTPDAPQPSELAGDLASTISTTLVVSMSGMVAAVVLLPLGVVLFILAARARRRQAE